MSERDRIEQALTFDTGCEPSAQEIIDALNRAGYQITPQAGEAVSSRDNYKAELHKADCSNEDCTGCVEQPEPFGWWDDKAQQFHRIKVLGKMKMLAELKAHEVWPLYRAAPQAGEAEPVGVVTDAMVERGCIALKAVEHPSAPNYWADTKEGSWKDLWRQKVRAAINAALSCHPAPPRPACPHLRSSDEGTQWCDLAAKPVTPGWQPISTAPRDEPFVGYFGNGEIHIVEIDSERNECFRPMDEERWAMPTHWQPLPSPPDSPGATEEA